MLSLPHRPGALNGIMARFSAIDVTLTKLEGGAKDNAIPRSCEAILFCDGDLRAEADGFVAKTHPTPMQDFLLILKKSTAQIALTLRAVKKLQNIFVRFQTEFSV